MAGRFYDDDRAYYHTHSSLNAVHGRAQSVQIPRSDHRTSRSFGRDRRRSYPTRAFVEDEASALAREYNPSLIDSASITTDEEPKYRGAVDQVPLFDPVPENNPERRFVILPKSGDGTQSNGSSDHDKPSDKSNKYEANTCRKFTVPRVDGDSVPADGAKASKAAVAGAAAVAAAATVAAAAAAETASTTQPTIQRRKSRLDLPRIDTEMNGDRISGPPRPKSAAYTDHNSSEHHRQTDHDLSEQHNSAFLSPSITKYATKGRDRTYYGQENVSSSATRARSRDNRLSDDRRTNGNSPDNKYRRRSSSFNDTEKPSRRLSFTRTSRDEGFSTRTKRNSPSPSPKERRAEGASPMRERERESEREREREREKERAKEREREREQRERERERERDHRDRERRDYDSDRDRRGLGRRDSAYRKHRSAAGRLDVEDDKIKSASTPALRRQPSDRRKGPRKDEDATSGSDTRRLAAAASIISGSGPRFKSAGGTPISTPRISQAHIPPVVVGSIPSDLCEPSASPPPRSPTRVQREERKRNEDRKYGSSSASSSPESLARIPDTDRPRGPRQARMPNVIHNPISYESRAGTLSMPPPISTTIPVRGHSSVRVVDGGRHHERSPSDARRLHGPQLTNPVRNSGVFDYSPSSSQTGRTPAFYVNIAGGHLEDRPQSRLSEQALDWQPDSQLSRSLERHPDPALGTYRQHAYDLPACPRQTFSSRHHDWRALAQFPDFFICPTCYEAAFANSPYRNEFVPTSIYSRESRVRCTFGSLHWYKVARYLNNKYQLPTLSLVKVLFDNDEQLRLPCPGSRRVMGDWSTILDPFTGKPVPDFSVCQQCASAVRVLFPWLRRLLQVGEPYSRDAGAVCALYHEPDRKRLWKYIEVLEKSNELAETTNSPPDVEGIVNKLLAINFTDECKRDIPVRGRKWYWMRKLPEFVVCEECFDEFVYPKVNMYRAVAGDFYKEPKEITLAACHLYSPRMRAIFLEACKNSDKAFLEAKLEERDRVAKDVTNRLGRVSKLDRMEEERETNQLLDLWKKWE